MVSLCFHTNTYVYNMVKTNSRKHLFHSISMTYGMSEFVLTILILRNKGFHEFVFTVLPRSLFNTLMDLSYSAFVSKLFISNDSLILRSCMLDNFANIFWVQPIKPTMTFFGMFSCTRGFPFSYLPGVQLIE